MFEKVHRQDILVAALLMLFVYLSIDLLLPDLTLISCSGSPEVLKNQTLPSLQGNNAPTSYTYSTNIHPASCLSEFKTIEPFPQYYNLRLLLMLLVGPGYYAYRNRPRIQELIEATALIAGLYAVLYILVYLFVLLALSPILRLTGHG